MEMSASSESNRPLTCLARNSGLWSTIQCQCQVSVYDTQCQLTPKICQCMAMQFSKIITVIWYK